MIETDLVQGYSTGQKFKIFYKITCDTVGDAYLINCLDCKKQYVGETGGSCGIDTVGKGKKCVKLVRLWANIFNLVRTFELVGIEKLINNSKKTREEVELRWVYRLNTFDQWA